MPDNHATFESDTTNIPAVLALATKPGPGSNGVHGITSSPADSAVYGEHSGAGIGVFGRGGPDGGEGVFGQTANASSGVYGKNTAGGVGVTGESPSAGPGVRGMAAGGPASGQGGGNGVIGMARLSSGVAGFTLADSNRASGVFGAGPAVGVAGGVNGSNTAPSGRVGVYGTGSNGQSLGGTGVFGESDTEPGVFGKSTSGTGVDGLSETGPGVVGVSGSGQGVGLVGISNGRGILAAGGNLEAGLFFGNVEVTGNIFKGGGGFMIDHPLDPANRYLRHSFVESSEMKNLYDGIVVCDSNGEATISLPEWFEALNNNVRYQLTPVGAPAPDLHISEELQNHQFKLAGGSAGLKVSWQVSGVRRDGWAAANPILAEEDKTEEDRGRYLHPEAHGQPRENGIHADLYATFQQHLSRIGIG